jgi:hypothetical protein
MRLSGAVRPAGAIDAHLNTVPTRPLSARAIGAPPGSNQQKLICTPLFWQRCSAQIPAQQCQDLPGGPIAREAFADQGRSETQHRHTPVEAFHRSQCRGIPGPARGEAFTEALQRFVLERGFSHSTSGEELRAYGHSPPGGGPGHGPRLQAQIMAGGSRWHSSRCCSSSGSFAPKDQPLR